MLKERRKKKNTQTQRTQRKCVFIESSPLMIPTTLGIKAPVWIRTPMDHLQAPDLGSCHLACGSPCWRRAALASHLHLWAPAPPASKSPEGWSWPDLPPWTSYSFTLCSTAFQALLTPPLPLVFLPTKSTHLSDLFTEVCLACSKHSINIHQMNERISQPYTYLTHVPTCEGTIFNSGSW